MIAFSKGNGIFLQWIFILCFMYLLLGITLRKNVTFKILSNTYSDRNVIKYSNTFLMKKTNITFLLWTEFFGKIEPWLGHLRSNFEGGHCKVTADKSQIESADVVVFHFLDLWFWKSLPKYRSENQIWILATVEPPPHIHYLGLKVPKMTFNWTLSYRNDSEFVHEYGRFQELTHEDRKLNMQANESVYDKKTKMAFSIISNCVDDSRRYRLVDELNKYIPIDQYGDCGHMTLNRTGDVTSALDKYMFKIAFENTNGRDYVTEKFWGVTDSIPIVNWKRNQIVQNAPPKTYINVYDFRNVKELADYLKYVSKNRNLYNSYFVWRQRFKKHYQGYAGICNTLRHKRHIRAQVIVDPWVWVENDTCEPWSIKNAIARHWDRFLHDGIIF